MLDPKEVRSMCDQPSLKISLREKLETAIKPDKIRVVEEMNRTEPVKPQ